VKEIWRCYFFYSKTSKHTKCRKCVTVRVFNNGNNYRYEVFKRVAVNSSPSQLVRVSVRVRVGVSVRVRITAMVRVG